LDVIFFADYFANEIRRYLSSMGLGQAITVRSAVIFLYFLLLFVPIFLFDISSLCERIRFTDVNMLSNIEIFLYIKKYLNLFLFLSFSCSVFASAFY